MSEDGPGKSRRPEHDRSTADAAWAIVSYLLAGMLVWGGVGWLLDRWLHKDALFLPIGLLFGISAAMYLVVARINRSS
jgi:F0F1-type ATP synthase assembly protein I